MENADAHRPIAYADVPTIDVTPFVDAVGHSDAQREAVVQHTVSATTRLGFMNLIGHGVCEPLITDVIAVAREFFEQPMDIKLRSTGETATSVGYSIRGKNAYHTQPDQAKKRFKEIFDLGPSSGRGPSPFPQNVYPEVPGRFRSVMDTYYAELERVQSILFRVISLALGRVTESPVPPDFLERGVSRHRGLLRINYYPRCEFVPAADALRDGAHTDWSTVTILLVEKEGLEVQEEGAWKRVPMRSGSFIVNIGDLLHRWSNGDFRSSLHRVGVQDCRSSSRISIAYFATECIDPTDDAEVIPVCGPGKLPLFEPVTIRDYVGRNLGSLRSSAP